VSARSIIRILSIAIAMTSGILSGPLGIPAAHADSCPDVEVVFARGTGQAAGVGQVGQAFVDSLGSQINGRSMAVYPVNYPAATPFASSAQTGSDDVVARINDMIGRCPSTRMVLGGFSQGAGVMDLATRALPPQAVDHVAAVALFGKPTSPLAGNFTDTVFTPIGPPYSDKTIDLCAEGDPACSDGRNLMAHGSYVESGLTAQAATFVARRL
jgi:cutinase